MQEILRVLNLWHKVECFNSFDLKQSELNITKNKEPQWINNQQQIKTKPEGYIIYLGVFKSQEVEETVQEIFGGTDDYENSDDSGLTCFGTVLIDGKGKIVEDTVNLSILPFAIGQCRKDKLSAVSKINQFYEYTGDVKKIINKEDKPCTKDVLNKMILTICELAYWEPKTLVKGIIYFKQYDKIAKNSMIKDDVLLNSFYIKDIEIVQKAVNNGQVGNALKKYLNGLIEENSRVDLIKNETALKSILSAKKLSLGRWPSNSQYPLSLMQQAAINLIMGQLYNKRDIISINGPPGTGKTTLLRDVVATLVTERAKILTQYDDPREAFTKHSKFSDDKNYPSIVYSIDSRIRGFGIVVASSNNGAAENISKEIPNNSAIAESFLTSNQCQYFKNIAQNIYGENTWGLLAIALGKSENRSSFVDKIWFSGDHLRNHLKSVTTSLHDWKSTKKLFNVAYNKVESSIKTASLIEEYINKVRLKKNEVAELRQELESIDVEILQCKQKSEEINTGYKNAIEALEKCYSELINAKAAWGNFLSRSWWWFTDRRKYSKSKAAKTDIPQCEKNLDSATNKVIGLEESIKIKEDKYIVLNNKREKIDGKEKQIVEQIKYMSEEIEKSKKEFDGVFPDQEFWDKPIGELHISAPWLSNKLNQARSDLFIEALRVHQTFIEIAHEEISKNFGWFVDLLKNKEILENDPETIQYLWDVAFLVIPVISTTFASVGSMFKRMGNESLDWLFIDEAGQALPQAAVGAIWRSKRVVVLGDPLQIEPIFKVSDSIVSQILKYHHLDYDLWNPGKTSVQILADRNNKFGTYIRNYDGEVRWVGCPLLVHRRCIEPMFTICNKIAYDNLMISATSKPINKKFPSGPSRWVHVKGNCEGKHWVPAQGDIALAMAMKEIEVSINDVGEFPSLFIISPFSRVERSFKKKLKKALEEKLSSNNLTNITDDIRIWIESAVGTIHVFQGKQANTVILLLGVDDKNTRPISWAIKNPNILNVAVSRAMYRLYIIGDSELWGNKKYFETAFKYLKGTKKDFYTI